MSVTSVSKFLVFGAFLLVPMLSAQTFPVEWIFSDARRQIEALPRFEWKDNNQALWLDMRLPEEERKFEWFNPSRRVNLPAFDMGKALAGLVALYPGADSIKTLAWPETISDDGRYAVYLFDGDIYILELEKSGFMRITGSDAVEKAVRFSPDGNKIAFVRDNDLYTYAIGNNRELRLTSDGSETILNGTVSWVYWEEIFARQDLGYWWSDDSQALAFLRTDESAVDLMHYVDFKPVVPRVITQRYPKAGSANPVVHVGIVEPGKQETVWVELGDVEDEYVARVQWLPDSKRVCVQTLNRNQEELNMFFVDRKTGRGEHILKETDEGWVNLNDDLYFLQDSDHFLWQSERDGYAHLYRFKMDGTLVNQITKGNWALRSSSATPFWLRRSVLHIDEKKEQVYFTALEKSSVERHAYRIDMDGGNMVRLTDLDGTHRTYFSPDGKYYIDNYANLAALPSLTLFDNTGRRQRSLAENNMAALRGFAMQYPDLLKIPTREGFPMPAQLLKPANFNANRKYPLILYVYGGPSAPTVFNDWGGGNFYFDQLLLQAGFLVARVDHPASTAISKILENRLLNLISGPTELADLLDGVKWLKGLPYVDASRVGIWGWSGGGSFTLNAMTNSPEFKAGIAVAPVTDWRYYDTRWAEFAMKLPEDNPDGYSRTSYLKSAKNLHGRLLLVHGTYDDNVHPQNSWAFIEELIQHNLRFEMMFYPMRKHGIADDPARIHLYNTMLEFWKRNL